MMLILVGPHGVGKSTLGPMLAHRLGLPFHPELGRALAEDAAWRPVGTTAADAATAFDRELFVRELARDAQAPSNRIVETWHPGNLAFATGRSPAEALRWLPALRAACVVPDAWVLPLMASPATLRARQTEIGDPEFFHAVGEAAITWAAELGLRMLPPLWTDRASPSLLADRVARQLARRRRLTSLPLSAQPWS